jgi:alginate O-acetyltransferase complex protein AlgI
LGGNRKGSGRALCNQLIVFTATGLWHGANFTFLVWGLFHGLFLVMESSRIIPVGRICKHPVGKLLVRAYTWLVVLIGFVLFRAESMGYAIAYLKTMLLGGGMANGILVSKMSPWFWFVFVVSVVFSFPLTEKLRTKMQTTQKGNQIYGVASYGFSILLLLICMGALAAATYNPFIYFRF